MKEVGNSLLMESNVTGEGKYYSGAECIRLSLALYIIFI